MQIPIKDIIIGERQRLSLGDLTDLDSMSDPEVGLIQPIIVHKTLHGYELVAGRRRLAKATSLNWPTIEAVEKDTLTPIQKNKMELFEDVGRTDRSWQDRCLSVAKLHRLMTKEKKDVGEEWTTRHTSIATGFGSGAATVRRMLIVADLLRKEPKDQEIWDAANFTEAHRIIIDRNEKEARAELERRRAVLNQPILQVTTSTKEWSDAADDGKGEGEKGSGPKVTLTSPAPSSPTEPLKILIHGFPLSFEDAKLGVHIHPKTYSCILAHNLPTKPEYIGKLLTLLRPNGFCTLWYDHPTVFPSLFESNLTMPWRLIWNRITCEESSPWPFARNYSQGFVFRGSPMEDGTPIKTEPLSSVISAVPEDDGTLPFAVVSSTLQATCPPNLAVLCPCNAPVVAIAEEGRIPIFFEPDEARFNQKVQALKDFYLHNFPDAEISLRPM
jgi:ParB/RepB/Spo0J family partition protein